MGKLDKISVDYRKLHADQLDILRLRMEMLLPQDRVWLEAWFKHNIPFSKLACITGLAERTIARQVNNRIRGLLAEDYITLYRARARLTRPERQVAYDHFLLGMGYRRIAEKRRLSARTVRGILNKLSDCLLKINLTLKSQKGAEECQFIP